MENRLKNEYKNINRSRKELANDGIAICLDDESDLSKWTISLLFKDKDSPYAGQTHLVSFVAPKDYPFNPPQCHFTTHIFHPNVRLQDGKICLNILENDWHPSWSLYSLSMSLLALCYGPNTENPINCDASNLIKNGDARAIRCMSQYYYEGEYTDLS